MKSFISLAEASEKLLLAGFKVKVAYKKFEGFANHSLGLIADDEVAVAWGYKDGPSWAFKAVLIDEFIAKNSPEVPLGNPDAEKKYASLGFSSDSIGDYYKNVELKRNAAVAKLEAAKANGASRSEICKLEEAAIDAGNTGD